MRFSRLLVFIALLLPFIGSSQSNFTISGEIKDAETGETIPGAVVKATPINKGTVANIYGFYSLTLPSGKYSIEFSFLGYVSQTKEIDLNQNQRIDIALSTNIKTFEAVEITADKSRNTESTDVGKIALDVDQIKKLPVLLGEIDILKTITLLPGVQSSGEGNAGFYVRGGGVDQNLILLDNATVYNASHLFGFFSVFNADAVKNLELTKGGVPANFGGRLASVLDISLKEGNNKEFHGEGGIGLISSRLTLEGPIKKDTSSFIISARRTYIDLLMKPFINKDSPLSGSGYYFYDLNAKVNYRISKKDQVFLSGYFGRDVFGFSSENSGFSTRIPWGNATGTVRWNRIISDKLFMNTIATFTDYKFSFEGAQEQFEFALNSGIRDWGAKVQWNYYPNYRHSLKWGVDYTYHIFTPNSVYAKSGDTEFDTGPKIKLFSHEVAGYVLDEFDVTEKLKVNAGVRYSYFLHVGPFTRFTPQGSTGFGQTLPPLETHYGNGEKVANYAGFEPRINFRWTVDKHSSIKGGYMRNFQYIHLTSLSPTSLPTDVWLPSTDVLKPQFGQQWSIGYFRNFLDDMLESSLEVYYKNMKNVSEYKEGAQPQQTVNDNIDNLLVFGIGRSYGAELFVKKRIGTWQGWIGYTWSKTERRLDQINNGDWYPSRWDRRHDISIVSTFKLSPRVEIGAVFVYGTGNAITLPVERYIFENRVVDVYGARNSFRMAPYHRADISCTLYPKPEKQKNKKFESNWNFSIYNLYNRKNPYFIYFGNDGNVQNGTLQIKAYQVSLFPILPSVTWNFKF
ncbi:MAG: TonB-dependent receptor [Flavobacteriales bacterium]